MFYDEPEGKVINLHDSKITRFFKRLGYLVIVIVIAIYFLTGIYVVGPDEVGMVRTLGKFSRQVPPGLHYHLPYPFQTVVKPKVTELRRIEIGFRTLYPGAPPHHQLFPEESLMLTGDENIVDCQYIVQYRISDPYAYLFLIRDAENAVRNAAEAAMREVVGKKGIDEVLTVGRSDVQQEARSLTQEILDSYQSGIDVVAVQLQDVQPPQEVAAAFRDVASAREDRARFINQAQAYRNQVVPQARGEAAKILEEAQAFQATVIKEAEGEAARFLRVLSEYQLNPDISRERIFLETMETVWPQVNKFIFDSQENNESVLKFLPLVTREAEDE
ncbi:FtsH protease activity modulator HflK [Candidatus Sordicultor fermentans]|uniref:FtsH protease activity modulator HflK n=1 Tax=Candidatus Sordicultor fermentans TaxID=1953203 RepID=UPI001697E214|nr:FtsH protease activity modulator HflK [Candidatus Atribacteria bacterium]